MKTMRHWTRRTTVAAFRAAAFALALGAVPALAQEPSKPPAADEEVVRVVVTRGAEGAWTATYHLPRAARAWVFPRSAVGRESHQPWRPDSWRLSTGGVSLVRSGGRDVLLAAGDAVPATVEIAFEPYTRLLIADYVPVLAFSDGGRALFTGVFEIGVADLEALATDEDPLDATLPLAIDFVDAGGGPVLVDGRLLAGGARFDGPLHTYAYFGTTEPVRTDRLVLLLDEAIPEWIRSELESFLPALMDLFTRRLGAALPEPPTIYAVWDGAEHRGHSQGGSVMAGFLAANFGGRGLLRPDADALARLRTFYAHEAAHFWNGGVVLPREREHAWVSEGGADWLAIRAMAELVPGWDAAAARRGKVAACRDHGGGAALNAAEAENRHDASYACGALAHALAERSLAGAGQSTFDLWAEVLRRGEAEGGEYDMETWLGALEDLGGDGELAAMLRRWAEEGLADGEFASATALANRHPSRGSEGSNRR